MLEDKPAPRPRGEVVRSSVLGAAVEELAAGGIDGASVANIAARAGVHETTIYRRWKTRENLLVDALLARSSAAMPTPDTGSVRGDLSTLLRLLCDYLSSPLGNALLRAGALAIDDDRAQARRAFWTTRLAAVQVIIDRAVERGELQPGTDAHLAVEMLVAPVHLRLLLTGEPLDPALPDQVTDVLLNGLRQP